MSVTTFKTEANSYRSFFALPVLSQDTLANLAGHFYLPAEIMPFVHTKHNRELWGIGPVLSRPKGK